MTPQERLVILRVAVVDAIAAYWSNRAKSYEARGHHEVARACRNRAAFALMGGDDDEVEALLADPEVVGDLATAPRRQDGAA